MKRFESRTARWQASIFRQPMGPESRQWASLIVLFLLVLGMSGYAVVTPYYQFWLVPKDFWPTQMLSVVIAIAFFTAALLQPRFQAISNRLSSRKRQTVYVAAILFLTTLTIGVISRLYLIHTRKPGYTEIDVPYVNEAAVAILLQFKNPYNELFFSHTVYNYPPFSLLYYTPFIIAGDLRFGNVAADILTAIGIFLIGLNRSRPVSGALVASFFSLSSLSMVTTYYGNNHMVTAAFLVLTVLALVYKRFRSAGCLLALSALATQFGVLAVPFIIYYAYSVGKLRPTLLATVVTTSCILLPFAATAKNLTYNLAGIYIFNLNTQILGQQVTGVNVFGMTLTRLIGVIWIGFLMLYPIFANRLKKAVDLRILCAVAVLSTLILAVVVAPNFFEAYLIPSLALILVYSVL